MTLKTPTGRLARWALQLQPYNLIVQYTLGKANVIADTLSRPPIVPSSCQVNVVEIDLPTDGAQRLRQQQLEDSELKKIIGALSSMKAEETQLSRLAQSGR